MIFSNPTVRDGSTKNFRRNGNLRAQILLDHDSEPQATRLSSVKDVTATTKVQTHCHSEQCNVKRRWQFEIFSAAPRDVIPKSRVFPSGARDLPSAHCRLRLNLATPFKPCPLPSSLPVIYTSCLP